MKSLILLCCCGILVGSKKVINLLKSSCYERSKQKIMLQISQNIKPKRFVLCSF